MLPQPLTYFVCGSSHYLILYVAPAITLFLYVAPVITLFLYVAAALGCHTLLRGKEQGNYTPSLLTNLHRRPNH